MGAGRRRGRWILLLLIGAAVAATVVNFLLWERAPETLQVVQAPTPGWMTAGTPPVETAVPSEAPPPSPEPVGPSVENTDTLVRSLAAGLSAHPGFAKWLATDDLIRKFVVIVDNVARGEDARPQLSFLGSKEPFRTLERDGRVIVDPKSYARYDGIAEVVVSLDAKALAQLYRELKPYIDEAHRELGYPDRTFDETFSRAIQNLLDVPIVEGEIPLEPRVTTYEYAEERLEGLSSPQKALLRMGPANVRKVQEELRELRAALDLDRSTS